MLNPVHRLSYIGFAGRCFAIVPFFAHIYKWHLGAQEGKPASDMGEGVSLACPSRMTWRDWKRQTHFVHFPNEDGDARIPDIAFLVQGIVLVNGTDLWVQPTRKGQPRSRNDPLRRSLGTGPSPAHPDPTPDPSDGTDTGNWTPASGPPADSISRHYSIQTGKNSLFQLGIYNKYRIFGR